MQYIDTAFKYKNTIREILNDDNERAVKYRNLFDLNKILDRNLENLSGGELQRVICALACSKVSKFSKESVFIVITSSSSSNIIS